MANFGQMEMPSGGYNPVRAALNPNDPDYLKKLGMIGAIEGHHELNAPNLQVDKMDSGNTPHMGTASSTSSGETKAAATVPDTDPNAPQPKQPRSVLSKIGHGLEVAGNVAGDIFAPATMSLIPGTQLYGERQKGIQFERSLAEEREAETRAEHERTAAIQQAQIPIKQEVADADKLRATTGQLSEQEKAAFDQSKIKLEQDAQKYKQQVYDPEHQADAVRALNLRSQEIANQFAALKARIGLENAQMQMLPYTYQLKMDAMQLQTAIASARNDQERAKLQEQYTQLTATDAFKNMMGLVGGMPEMPKFAAPDLSKAAPLTPAGGATPKGGKKVISLDEFLKGK